MNLSVKDAAQLLTVSEKTIYRWIKQEIIPAYKVHESYRFNRAELLEWATSRRMGLPPEAFSEPETDALPLPRLHEALEAGGIFYRIEGATREKVLADTVEHLRLGAEVDRDYLYKVLLAREKLSSTAVGDGIAVPRPRNPALLHLDRTTLTLCFLEQPADFAALDGQPVRMLFTLLAPTLRFHLHLLSKLSFVLRDPTFMQTLQNQGSREEIFTALRHAEEALRS
ncbi:PTS sugar transporter subunit IIA [Geoalkalibacter halelectricus]|uniref:PTS sugar transporter subunit IIA n=1 Tax=Geoalkalibacter halelectricus TaxID=2847045 RepID=A0ABY5ZJH9_9BACT|nr:PTS sugar transporter subunit IIA [Geoalkalibacter halelectricus]MDO3378286.1 PTS sugar transporter subunit IIA [Geoalkalibacter halelectricus]UWZ79292.1 PTS sugar transporter subunit IIA [Geoalkalibacter halelectricus]